MSILGPGKTRWLVGRSVVFIVLDIRGACFQFKRPYSILGRRPDQVRSLCQVTLVFVLWPIDEPESESLFCSPIATFPQPLIFLLLEIDPTRFFLPPSR
jgi:hypothetical protein